MASELGLHGGSTLTALPNQDEARMMHSFTAVLRRHGQTCAVHTDNVTCWDHEKGERA